ncbi:MAG TPA: O-antigen polymerase [Phycisphaerae bacterium]|nr:O-antigen polymerase [Phycisphaerae bacterium]
MAAQLIAAPRTGRKILTAFLLCVCLAAVLAAAVAPEQLSRAFVGSCAFAALGVFGLQMAYQASGPRQTNWISVDILFMLGFLIVHFTYPLFWVTGLVPSDNEIWFSQRVVCFSSALCLAGLAAFALGFNIPADRYSRVQGAALWDVPVLQKWRAIGTVVFIFGGIATTVWLLLARERLAAGGYVHITEFPYSVRITFLLSEVLLRLGLLLATVAAAQLTGRWRIGVLLKVGLVLFVGWLLILGDRSAAAAMGVLALAAYSEYVRRISLKVFVVVTIGGLLLLAVVRLARHTAEHTVTEFVRTAKAESHELTWQQPIMNFGASVKTVFAATHTIPDQENYYYGKLQVSSVAGIIPFSRRFLPPEKGFSSSARVLTDVINEAGQEWGRGTTIVADLYCDFGFPGVVSVLFFVGLLCKHIQQRARASNSITWAVAHAALIATMALMPRYALATLVRGVLWPALAVLLVSWSLGLPRNAALALRRPIAARPREPLGTGPARAVGAAKEALR